MQLRSNILILLFAFSAGILIAQDEKPVEIDFLLNYYDQDGDHSAVTGGTGTEKLSNIGTKIIINIPSGADKAFNISLNADSYTSASSNKIDPVRSGASGQDLHVYGHLEYSVDRPEAHTGYSLAAGFSNEFDYNSFSLGGSWTMYSIDKNREFTINTMNFIDFISLIYPVELRRQGKLLKDDQRQTYSLSLNYSQVINKNLQMSFMTDLVFQKGLLSTPFNRVFFNDNAVDVERLPDNRFKFPLGLRLNYYLTETFVTRFHYRYYNDSFGVSAHSLSLELPLRLNQAWAITPFIRYHDQQAADYFAPYKEHTFGDEFYTSDYDLSAFNSLKTGLAIRYYPLDNMGSIFNAIIKRLDLRVGYYDRSDGLNAYNVTAGISFSIQ
jgi:hypothetical protein